MDLEFVTGYIPVAEAAKILKKDPTWVRQGIIGGWLPIGIATRNGKKVSDVKEIDIYHGRINFYISPKKFYDYTGYVWRGEEENEYRY